MRLIVEDIPSLDEWVLVRHGDISHPLPLALLQPVLSGVDIADLRLGKPVSLTVFNPAWLCRLERT